MRTGKITCKMCRREGVSLCGREKCAFKRRPYPPGAHGPTTRTRVTEYGRQLREKQKAKRFYGVSERQFRNYFEKAITQKGETGENLVRLLETRLDNAVYRAGLAKSRAAARQVVSHAHVDVNGQKVDIPSFHVKAGDVIRVRENKRNKSLWKAIEESLKNFEAPSWIVVDSKSLEAKVTSTPVDKDLQQPFDSTLIVEFYSR